MADSNEKGVQVELKHDVQINGQKIPAGKQFLPKGMAEDAVRLADDYQKHIESRNTSEEVNAAKAK